MVVVVRKAERYTSANRAMLKTKSRVPWRHRMKKKAMQKSTTPAEKKARALARLEKKETLNAALDKMLIDIWKMAEEAHKLAGQHTVKYWYERLLQQAGKKKATRKLSRWNVFLSKEMKKRNESKYSNT